MTTIRKTDPSAREKIADRLDGFKRNHQQMRLVNRFLKAGNDAGLLGMGFTADQIARLKVPDLKGCIGFAPVTLRNNAASIARLKERLEHLP